MITITRPHRLTTALLGVSAVVGIALGAGAGAASAEPQVRDVGIIDNHRAFEIGPYATQSDCLPTQDALIQHNGQPTPAFASCYVTDTGWYILSPFYA